jgi:long-chain acyl-CoA synthetase
MIEPTRLFDCLGYLLQKSAQPDLLAAKENGVWRQYSTQEVKDTVDGLTAGLMNIGISYNDGSVEGRDKVAVISKNRPEWLMLDMAVQQAGAILVPVYPTIHINELEFILNDAQVKIIFVNDRDGYEKVSLIKARVPSLRAVYSSLQKSTGSKLIIPPARSKIMTLLRSSIRRAQPAHPRVLCCRTIIY